MKQRKDGQTLAWLNQVARGKRRYIFLLTIVQSVLGVTGVGYALLLQGIVDCAVTGDGSGVRWHALLLFGLVLLNAALRALLRYFEELTKASLENNLKSRLFSGLLTRDYGAVSAVHSGEWMNRLSSDTVVVANGATQIIPGVMGTGIRMVSALAALLAVEPAFGGIFVVGGIFLILLTIFMRKGMKQRHSRVQAADGVLRVFLSERLGSMMTIRAFGKEQPVLEQSEDLMDGHKAARMHRTAFSTFCNTGLNLTTNGAYALGAVYCGSQILSGRMSYGTLTAVLQLISQAQSPIASLTGFLPQYYSMLSSAERLMEAEDFDRDCTEPAVPDMKRFYREEFQGLELRDAGFTYRQGRESPEVLNHLNLTIRKGEYVAFTGPSGCGKSTVLKLLMSLYPLDSGERLVHTRDGIQPLSAAWRGLFAYVPQGNQLMNGTIREVVTFGEETGAAGDAAVWRALEIACAEPFVRELKDGLDTPLGERGTGLSEGQMQRIAIARAIYSDRPILLLDEATSALDEVTEKALLRKLREMTDQTVIIVTHRPAVLEVTDQEVRFHKN